MSYRTKTPDATPPGPRGPGLLLGLRGLLDEQRAFPVEQSDVMGSDNGLEAVAR